MLFQMGKQPTHYDSCRCDKGTTLSVGYEAPDDDEPSTQTETITGYNGKQHRDASSYSLSQSQPYLNFANAETVIIHI